MLASLFARLVPSLLARGGRPDSRGLAPSARPLPPGRARSARSVAVHLDHLSRDETGPRNDRSLLEGDAEIVGSRRIHTEVQERRILAAVGRRRLDDAVADERLAPVQGDFGADRPLLSVGSGERDLQPSARGSLVDEERVRSLLARDENVEVSVVVHIGEDRGAGVEADPVETDAVLEAELPRAVVEVDAGVAGHIEVEIAVQIHVSEGAGVVHALEAAYELKAAFAVVPIELRAVVSGDDHVEIGVIVDVLKAEAVRPAVVAGDLLVSETAELGALHETIRVALKQRHGAEPGALQVLERRQGDIGLPVPVHIHDGDALVGKPFVGVPRETDALEAETSLIHVDVRDMTRPGADHDVEKPVPIEIGGAHPPGTEIPLVDPGAVGDVGEAGASVVPVEAGGGGPGGSVGEIEVSLLFENP